jgi:Rieske 2Fe-2S family protein
MEILVWETGWYMLYRYWPTSHNTHRFEGSLYFAPSQNPSDRAARECAVVMFKEFALQDAGTLEGTQLALESRVVDAYPLCDQEVLVRHLHKSIADWVADYCNPRLPEASRV